MMRRPSLCPIVQPTTTATQLQDAGFGGVPPGVCVLRFSVGSRKQPTGGYDGGGGQVSESSPKP
eukprot:897751-Pyramimonas_sp.AAC.2